MGILTRLFRRPRADFFTEEPAEERFDAMMNLVKDLSRKDYNKLKKAMDSGYNAYQIVRGLEALDEDSEVVANDFMITANEK